MFPEDSSNYAQMILDNSTDAIVLMGLDYSVLAFNQNLKETILAYSGKTIKIGDDYREFVTAGDKEVFFELFQKSLLGQSVTIERIASINAISIWFEYKMNPTYDKDKKLMGVCLRGKNIDVRKKMEIALSESEQKFRNLIESAPNAILIVDREGKIIHCNLETENTFGFSREELTNQPVELLVPMHHRKGHDRLLEGYFQAPKPMRIGKNQVTSAVKKDGTEIQVEVSLNSFVVNQTNYVSAIIVDITEKVLADNKIQKQIFELKEIARIQSHEIRSPLANILGLINLLESGLATDTTNEIYTYLKQSAKELDNLVCEIVNRTAVSLQEEKEKL
ncbi:PAS domain S-box protein [Leptospira sp. 2 VSF19]|uniref:histidine kinase n=1 Tax=Leptospira soteropolitanensis TaxID=2950025 RepID=A0AAW5VAL3_9LEPT|nr:PAS domain S-box protein [Leptospira soteropolitanensis]MCW7492383.1 PAS domain S-box protein [Leptospira soteropolitanensis]MCW7499963.1 PAS domain S-box protein [Leptospira soteropolitanensis]MCW7522215.1 PAS domain S-box protein [Leptospira soteropolitanensis]MCW7526070.1 PAS domain S-box protein [Leptospira soteropolitanensis]MCW7529818.1 PAS domain S-box protein [Leptospira soteropolitanensis]